MDRTTRFLTSLAVVLVFSVPAAAQSLLGVVTGTVTDESGAALPGATVTLTGPRGAKTLTSDTAGRYRFGAVDPGTYSVEASLTGFQVRKVEPVVVNIGKTADVDLSLKIGGLTDTVEVTGAAPIVDISTTQTDNNISQDSLYNLPLGRFTADLLNYTPGVNSGSAFGGGSDVSNGLYFDGVDTRDPQAGTPWVFVNFNIVDEVQVQGLGVNAEYGSMTGAIMNAVTKSGGNKPAGLFEFRYSRASLASNNITPEQLGVNPDLTPSKTLKNTDMTAQISGPIRQDKLFYFLSAQRELISIDPAGARTKRTDISPRLNGKITWTPSPSDTINLSGQYDQFNVTGRSGWTGLENGDDQTVDEEAPNTLYNAQWRHLFGQKTFLEAKFTGYSGYFDLYPNPQGLGVSGHYDLATDINSVSAGYRTLFDRSRNQLNASLTHYAEGWGQHDLKFGVEVERSRSRNRNTYENGIFYYDDTDNYPVGQYYGYDSSYELNSKIKRQSFFAQDAWKINSRLTVTAGVRLDDAGGYDGADESGRGKVYSMNEWSPRLGLAYDLTGDQKTVLRLHYGDLVDQLAATYFRYAASRLGPFEGYCYNPDGTDFVGPAGNTFDLCNFIEYPYYNVDPDLKHPRIRQYTATIERALTNDLRVSVTGLYRDWKNFVDTVLPDARWEPFEGQNDLTGEPLTLWSLTNPDEATANFLTTNVDGFRYLDPDGNVLGTARAKRNHKSITFQLNKRMSNNWSADLSYVYSKTEGTVDNDGNGTRTANFLTPNIPLRFFDGPLSYERPHEVKARVVYKVPKIDVTLGSYFAAVSGFPYTNFQNIPRGDLNTPFALISSSARQLYLEPRGSRRTDFQTKLDLRADKVFKLPGQGDEITIYADVDNVFNTAYVSDVSANVNSGLFGTPLGIATPRQLTLAARWSF